MGFKENFTEELGKVIGIGRTQKGDLRKWHPARRIDGKGQSSQEVSSELSTLDKGKVFTLSDYVWYNSSANPMFHNIGEASYIDKLRPLKTPTGNTGVDVPKLVIKEFQPDFLFNWGDLVEEAVGGILQGIGASSGSNNGSKSTAGAGDKNKVLKGLGKGLGFLNKFGILSPSIKGIARNASANHINSMIEKISNSKDDSLFTKDIIKTPVKLVRQMFAGDFLGGYEIPYYADTYLSAESIANWDRSGLTGQLGSTLGKLIKENLALDVPTTPTWTNENGGGAPPPLETELILYNKDVDALTKNYRFIHALIAGAYWTQIGYNQKSPNLYDVTIPGRLHYFYCAMDVDVAYLGKSRKLSDVAYNKFLAGFGTNNSGKSNFGGLKRGSMFPDGYKIKIKLQSLMPNNFNMYLDYLLNGSEENGSVDRDLVLTLGNIIGDVGARFPKVFNE